MKQNAANPQDLLQVQFLSIRCVNYYALPPRETAKLL